MLGHNRTSNTLNEIYSIMDAHETKGMDLFDSFLFMAILNHLERKNIPFQAACSECLDKNVASISFVEDGFPYLIMYDYQY